jgi:hypothetical protein
MNKTTKSAATVLALAAGLTANAWELKLSENHKIDFHGFGSQGFIATTDYDYLGDSARGSFEFTEVGVNASYSPFDRARIALQGFAFDVGQIGDMDAFLDFASFEYSVTDWLNFRGGRVRRSGGIYNHIQDLDLARTSVLLPQGVYDIRWRDFSTSVDGGQVYGNVNLGKGGSLSYELFAGLPSFSNNGGVAAWIMDVPNATAAAARLRSPSFDGFQAPIFVGAQLWWNTPINGLRAGAMIGNMYDFGYKLSVANPVTTPIGVLPGTARIRDEGDVLFQQYSLEYVVNNWTFQAEYYTFRFDATRTTSVFLDATGQQVANIPGRFDVTPDAWYVSAAYRFNKWLEVGSYYSERYADVSNRASGANGSQKDLALSFRFDLKDWWILKLEGHYIRGTALLQDELNNPNRDRDNNGWFMIAAKTTFSF